MNASLRTPLSRRRRRRRGQPSTPAALLRGVVVLAFLAGAAWFAASTPNGVPGRSYMTVYAVLPDVGNLRSHNDVRIAGLRVGQVLEAIPQDGKARVELQLYSNVGKMASDTTAAVRSNGLLGQRYLELIPGSANRELSDGDSVQAAKLPITLGIPEALQTFDKETRGAMTGTIDGLGSGLAGRSRDLNDALGQGPKAADAFRAIAGAVTEDPDAARALVPSLASAADAIQQAKDPLVQAMSPTAGALQPFIDRRSAVRDTLDLAPPALQALDPALLAGQQLLASARTLAAAVQTTLPTAPRSLRPTSALLVEARGPLRTTRPLLEKVRTAVPATLKITRSLDPVLKPLKQPLDNLLGPVTRIGVHRCELTNFARNWRSFLGFGTASGTKVGPLGEIRAEALVGMPFAEAGHALKLPEGTVDRDTYPGPCTNLSTTYSLVDPTK